MGNHVVLDTNVIVSSIFWLGNSHKIVSLAIEQKILNFTSPDMLSELSKVLREKFKEPEDKISEQLAIVAGYSQIKEPKIKVKVIKEDPSDNKVLECALSCNADYIVSGDRHLLDLKEYRRIKIVKPAEFIKLVEFDSALAKAHEHAQKHDLADKDIRNAIRKSSKK